MGAHHYLGILQKSKMQNCCRTTRGTLPKACRVPVVSQIFCVEPEEGERRLDSASYMATIDLFPVGTAKTRVGWERNMYMKNARIMFLARG
ncbi:hypothetical protein PAXRUDRAFT_519852 [Paxillus rubicundulus Ve08.2h10]|uniref:Uncharacterized protein n=1 Tax=Paxillus rubicundulus Ve08.2h10 TaxID=930991 RepID=A0A0D0DNE1_9AGAM|nr:hypothetical protein PAXRUDRAFT_519852 [Paxillus rubicundulus Ve08.2h10]